MPRISDTEYKKVLDETRAVVERLFREHGGPVPPSVVEAAVPDVKGSTIRSRLGVAAERGLLRCHLGGTYSPAVDAEGRPMRLVLMVEEAEPKSA